MNAIGRLCCLVIKFTAVRARILVSYKLHLSSSSPSITSKIYQIFFPIVLSEVLWTYHLHLHTQKFSFIHFKPLNFALSFLTHHCKPKASPKHTNTDQRHANFTDFESIIYALFWKNLNTFVMKISPITWILTTMLQKLAYFYYIILTHIS